MNANRLPQEPVPEKYPRDQYDLDAEHYIFELKETTTDPDLTALFWAQRLAGEEGTVKKLGTADYITLNNPKQFLDRSQEDFPIID